MEKQKYFHNSCIVSVKRARAQIAYGNYIESVCPII